VALDFVFSLIRSGRIVLLLDGYDEMAQYLHARERRTCLEALAELSAGGARGILTSRPNYFTENEELQVFEVLYASISHGRAYLGREAHALLAREAEVDQLLGQFLDRFERILKDLDANQTEGLIGRVLKDDPDGRDVVLKLLRRIFRMVQEGDALSLSGKPVIISYLLDVVEGLKESVEAKEAADRLSEWQVYRLIVDQLMIRDLRRSPEVSPSDRRRFLRRLAIFLSRRDHPVIGEEDFKDLVSREFRRELNREFGEGRAAQLERYFANLRSSVTLTRSDDPSKSGWRFSHNSLREFLLAEHLFEGLMTGELVSDIVPISDAMRTFAASRTTAERQDLVTRLASVWKKGGERHAQGQMLALVWDGTVSLYLDREDVFRTALSAITGEPIALNGVTLSRVDLSSETRAANLSRASFAQSTLTQVGLAAANLEGADFSEAVLEEVSLVGAQLGGAVFSKTFLVDVNISGADLNGADFSGVLPAEISVIVEAEDAPLFRKRFEGADALGYLRFNGAATPSVADIAVYRHHPRFQIVEKILERLSEQSVRQRLGLEQRGESRNDPPFARSFVAYLEGRGVVVAARGRKLVQVTERGREVLSLYKAGQLPREVAEFFNSLKG
jgi:uncharacterized protein YjbI with pentapeptide repeats